MLTRSLTAVLVAVLLGAAGCGGGEQWASDGHTPYGNPTDDRWYECFADVTAERDEAAALKECGNAP
jgi:ABC-type glycerol-3-phosphate transport system substrate-binding protein